MKTMKMFALFALSALVIAASVASIGDAVAHGKGKKVCHQHDAQSFHCHKP